MRWSEGDAADSRPALISACKALDRVIRSGRYWVPHWYKPSHWLAYWEVFGRPQAQPRYGLAIRETGGRLHRRDVRRRRSR